MKIKPFAWPKNIDLKSRQLTSYIVVHHSVSGDVGAVQIHGWHRERGWHGIGYHYVIRENGSIEAGRPEWAVGAHVTGKNSVSVGICLAGDFDKYPPTQGQITSLVWLVRSLQAEYPGTQVVGHRELQATACPGKLFPWDEFQRKLQEDDKLSFKDLKDCWYPNLALKAVELGLISGYQDGTLRPRQPVSREEMWLVDLRQHVMIDHSWKIPEMVKKFMPSVVRIWSGSGVGSGSFIAPDIILTNAHVVKDNKTVTVDMAGQEGVKGTVIKHGGSGPGGLDLALVRVERKGNPLKLASDIVHGEFCLVMGNPMGEWQSVSAGIVTRFGGDFIQVDATINPGNSGGVVINAKGEIIGVPTFKIVGTGIDNHNYSIREGVVRQFVKGVV